jgi:(p)ppGpp synthase/HD superfamily hydrolase
VRRPELPRRESSFDRYTTSRAGAHQVTGYSDRVNHALAYAAKHHDQQVRKGTRTPYETHGANVAIILTRYGRDEDTVLAGILFEAIEDAAREHRLVEASIQRIAEKFGVEPVRIARAVAERALDDDEVELAPAERRDDVLTRLAQADERSRWLFVADKVHTAGTLLADLRRTSYPDTVWSRFAAGREGTVRWYRQCVDALARMGFDVPIVAELRAMVEELDRVAR